LAHRRAAGDFLEETIASEFRQDAYGYVDAEPWVLADVRWHGNTKDGTLSVDVRQVDACRLCDGRVTEVVLGYPDMKAARKAVGLEE